MSRQISSSIVLLSVLAWTASGCAPSSSTDGPKAGEKSSPADGENGGDSKTTTDSGKNGEEKTEPVVHLEPYNPPTLAELDSKVKWKDMPVVDSLEIWKEHLAKEPAKVSVKEALAMKNEYPKNKKTNADIKSGLGRQPESDGEVNWDAQILRHIAAEVKSTNPIMVSSTYEFDVSGLTSFGLFGFDWNFNDFAMKDAVVSWQKSEDWLYDKVVIRDDLVWSDGTPITAHDVAFSFQTIMNPDVPVPAVRSGTDQLKWVEAYDDHTVVYFHKEALATNNQNINFPVIPKHIYEKTIGKDPTLQSSEENVKYENNPVCGGPYKIVRRIRQQEIVLERREDWYMHKEKQVRDKPYFKRIIFRVIEDPSTTLLALKGGEIEEALLNPEQWTTQTNDAEFYSKNTKITAPEWTYFYFGWNCKTPFFSDVRVRKAMSYAFDYEEMLDKLFYGLYEPSNGIYNNDAWFAPKNPPKPYKQDLDKAEDFLDEAGWTDTDGDGIRDKMIGGKRVNFEFSIICGQTPNSIKVCTLLKECLDRIGVVCHVRPTEFTVLQQLTQDHKFTAMMGGWGTGTDPDTGRNLWTTGVERNYVQYSNPEVDRLFDEGRVTFDRDKRAEIYGKIDLLIWEDQPYTFLFTRNAFYGFNKKLRGMCFSPRGPYNFGPGFNAIWQPTAAQ